jgi:hypothetical protein
MGNSLNRPRAIRGHGAFPGRFYIACVTLFCIAGMASAQEGFAQLSSPPFKVFYSPADEGVAQRTADTLERASAEYGKELPIGDDPVDIIICPSFAEFRRLAGSYGRAQVGGIAQSESGLIIVKAPYLLPPGEDYAATLRHELIHVLLARNTDPENVPRWLNEGIAMVISREIRWGALFRLGRMYAYGEVIPYWQLDFAFAPRGDEGQFGNAYAQAYSMTRFLQNRLGQDGFWALVHEMKTLPFDQALRKHAGMTPGELYQAWRRSLWKLAVLLWLVTGISAFQVMALLVLLAYWSKYRRGRRIMKQWEEEEAEAGEEYVEEDTDEYEEDDEDEDERF